MTPEHIVIAGRLWTAGLDWRYTPRTPIRSLRALARSAQADHLVTTPAGDGLLFGCTRMAETGHSGRPVSLALAVLPALRRRGNNGIAIFDCGDGRYWFVALTDGVLSVLSDVCGSTATIQDAVEELSRFHTGSYDFVIAPVDFLPDLQAENVYLDALLPTGRFPALLQERVITLRAVSTRKTTARLAMALMLVTAGWAGWHHYRTVQADKKAEEERTAFRLAQKAKWAAAHPSMMPWNARPSASDVIALCSERWDHLPLAIAGWTLSQTECGPDSTGHQVLVSRYRRSLGTVSDFVQRLAVYSPVSPVFDIPGPAGTAQFELPVTRAEPRKTERLSAAGPLLQSLTSWAQLSGASLVLRPAALNSKVSLPWTLYHFTLKTDLPPAQLFLQHSFPGLVVSKISLTLSPQQARLHYVLQGELYAH